MKAANAFIELYQDKAKMVEFGKSQEKLFSTYTVDQNV
jgi:hypothetical protein